MITINADSYPVLTGIQQDHWKSSFANYDISKYDVALQSKLRIITQQLFAETLPSRFILLTGAAGSGKSHCLVSLFRMMVAKNHGVFGADAALYLQFPKLIQEIIEGFKDKVNTRTALQTYFDARYLFIDDFSKSERVMDPTKIEGQVLYELLMDRFESAKTLIATTNYKYDDFCRMLKSVYGGHVESRVRSSCHVVEFPNMDIRCGQTAARKRPGAK